MGWTRLTNDLSQPQKAAKNMQSLNKFKHNGAKSWQVNTPPHHHHHPQPPQWHSNTVKTLVPQQDSVWCKLGGHTEEPRVSTWFQNAPDPSLIGFHGICRETYNLVLSAWGGLLCLERCLGGFYGSENIHMNTGTRVLCHDTPVATRSMWFTSSVGSFHVVAVGCAFLIFMLAEIGVNLLLSVSWCFVSQVVSR